MLLISFILLNVVLNSVDSKKVFKQCEYDYLDEPCPTDNCLPNAILLASGFDITDSTYKSSVLDLKWGTSYYFNQYNGKLYTIPDGVTVIPLSESDDITGTFIVHNTTESEQVQSDTMVDKNDYIIGMSSHTVDTYQSITSQYEQASQVGYVIYYYGFYAVLVPYNEQVLDPDTYAIIMDLPTEYDQDIYFEFISSYGTHYITDSKWGLKYKFFSSFKQCMINTYSESYVYNQVQTDSWIHSSEHTTYSGSSSTDSYYESRRYTSESFEGGNISYHNSASWDQWVDSGANLMDPVIIAMKLNPIFMIINDTIRQNNMKQAYYEYLQMKKDQQQLIIKQKKLGPRTVSYASFDISKGSIIPEFRVQSTPITLSANDNSNIFGRIGQCNRLTHYAYASGYTRPFCSSDDLSCNNYYCLTEFLCQRNADGDIRVQHYFDSNTWTNSVRSYDDVCVRSNIIQNNTDVKKSNSYYYIRDADPFYYDGKVSPELYTNTNYKNSYDMYYTDKRDILATSHVITYDGKYIPDNLMSITTFSGVQPACGGYGVCYMDCDYITVNVDANGAPVVGCGC